MSQLDEKQLGSRLQRARQAAGLTQQALCQKANLSYSTLAKIERGAIKTPSIFTIQSIASVLQVTLDELVGSEPAKPPARSRSRSGIRFVYFDVNNCLVHGFNGAFTRIAADCNLQPDVVETVFWRYNDQACRGDISLEQFNTLVAKQLGLPRFDMSKYYLETTEVMPYMTNLVRWAHQQHYGVGLLTNSMPLLIEQMLERQLLPNIPYDSIVNSSAVHLLKPERAIYELAQARADCTPEEILFVDDTRANLMAAEKLGWHVMWFDDARPSESAERLKAALELA